MEIRICFILSILTIKFKFFSHGSILNSHCEGEENLVITVPDQNDSVPDFLLIQAGNCSETDVDWVYHNCDNYALIQIPIKKCNLSDQLF